MTTIPVKLPALYDVQYRAFFNDARYSICEASTKMGKTLGCIVWQGNQVLSDRQARNHWWVAPVYPQADIAYRRVKGLFRNLIAKKNEADRWIEFRNGARWSFKTAEKPDNLYGEDVASLVGDEFTRMREEAWWAMRSTLTATGGFARFIGNVKGRGNWGYRLARKAEQGEPGYAYHKITADDAVAAGVFSQEELEDARKALPHDVFRELYYCEPSDDGGNPFGLKAIGECVRPLSVLEPEFYGVDLAKSVDYTVIIGLDRNGDVADFRRFHRRPWSDIKREVITAVGDRPALIDSTGVGDPIVEEVRRQCRLAEGYGFTSKSKQQLMEGLAVTIQHSEVGFPDGVIRNELDVFEYEVTRTGVKYAAPEGLHDDCVCGLALAVECKRRRAGYSLDFAMAPDIAGDFEPDPESPLSYYEQRRRADENWGWD